jgi:Trypsin-co-occurring domain 1
MIESGDQDLFPLRVGDGAMLYVAASRLNSKSDASEVEVSGRVPSTRQVIEIIGQFASELTDELGRTGATRFTVEFGCEIAVETGQVFAVLGKANTRSSLKVTLEWERAISDR